MAVYAVGDIQGCYQPLARLMELVNFDQSKDTLWCVGDLVNRGPDSLKVLRLLKSIEKMDKVGPRLKKLGFLLYINRTHSGSESFIGVPNVLNNSGYLGLGNPFLV